MDTQEHDEDLLVLLYREWRGVDEETARMLVREQLEEETHRRGRSSACGAWTHVDGPHAHEFCNGRVNLPAPNDVCSCPCHVADGRIEIRLPATFYYDHVDRDLPGGELVKRVKENVVVRMTPEELRELYSDANHYAVSGEYAYHLRRSARATVNRLTQHPGARATILA